MIAALYVERGGPYYDREGVDAWGVDRDARLYNGPHPVVAHPPCGPWGKLARFYKGNEHDCAPRAVDQVREFGGVLEHPRDSALWPHCGMPKPWTFADEYGGYCIEVCQVDWGHVARKRTWLYIVGTPRSTLTFPPPGTPTHWISGFRTGGGRKYPANYKRTGCAVPPGIKVCSAQQRRRTPPAFAEWLIDLAERARVTPIPAPREAAEERTR